MRKRGIELEMLSGLLEWFYYNVLLNVLEEIVYNFGNYLVASS